MNKKGRGEVEKAISAFFGIVVLFILFGTLISSGIFGEIFASLSSTLGILGFLVGLIIILAIVKAIWEAFENNDFF